MPARRKPAPLPGTTRSHRRAGHRRLGRLPSPESPMTATALGESEFLAQSDANVSVLFAPRRSAAVPATLVLRGFGWRC